MKDILLTIVTCLQNKQRIINQVENLKAYILPKNLKVYFCFGKNYDNRYAELLKEYNTLVIDVEDEYLNRSLKTKALLIDAYKKIKFDFLIKIDDDTILNYDLINKLEFNADYTGRFQKCDMDSFVQMQLFKFNIFEKIEMFSKIFDNPFNFATGDCYILSKKTVEEINAFNLPDLTKEDLIFLNEDQMVGYILCDKNISTSNIIYNDNSTFKNELQTTKNGFSIHPVSDSLFLNLIKKPFAEQLKIIENNSLKNLTSRKMYTKMLRDSLLNTIVDFLNKTKTIGLG